MFTLCCCIYLNASPTNQQLIKEKAQKAALLQPDNPDSALLLGYAILEESRQIGFTEGLGYAYVRIGSIFNLKGENDSALYYLNKAFEIRMSLDNKIGASGILRLIGFIYKNNGQTDSAFAAFYQSIRLIEESNDSISLGSSYLELAHLLCDYEELSQAKKYYDKSYALALKMNNQSNLAYCYEGYGKFYLHKTDFRKALENYLKAASIHNDLINKTDLATTYNNIAVCYDALEQHVQAIEFYKNSLSLCEELGNVRQIATRNYNLSVSFNNLGKIDSAIYFLKQSQLYAVEVEDVGRQAVVLKDLSELYAEKKDFLRAYVNYKQYGVLKDSLINSEKISSIAEMQTKYETEKKEQEITLLSQENKTKEAQRNLLFAVAISLLAGVVTLSFLYLQRKKIAKKNEFIAGQKIESLLDEQEIKTYNAMLEGQEEERMRIATDLHDRLGSMLSTVKLLFSALDDKIDQNHKETKKQYEKANYLIDEACVEVRRVSHNLGTGMVANFGLYRALEELCESIDDSGKIKCTMQAFGIESGSLKLKVEVGVYRMVQEAFNNTLKYAKAKNLTLQLNRNDEELTIMIEDDGVGFDLEVAKMKGGMGLNNLDMRATKLKGTLHIDTKIGRGATTIIEIPLNSTT